jgi:hypothetical protein
MVRFLKKQKITQFVLGSVIFLSLSSNVQAGGGVQLGLSNNYIIGALYSLSSLDGKDIATDELESGYVHSRFALHYDSKQESSFIDVFGEVGRFVLPDRRVGIGIGIRPIAGTLKDKEKIGSDNGDDLSLLEINIGVNVLITSWLSESIKLNSSVYYYQSPEIVSFGDFEGTSIKGMRVAFPIIASSELYFAYDHLSGKSKKNSENIDVLNTFSVGIRLGL